MPKPSKNLDKAIRYFIESNYFIDTNTRELCDDWEYYDMERIDELIEMDIRCLKSFLLENEDEILKLFNQKK